MKIFVTGCAGLLGSNYSRHLLQNGYEVVGIDNLSGGYKAFVPEGENFTFVNNVFCLLQKIPSIFLKKVFLRILQYIYQINYFSNEI